MRLTAPGLCSVFQRPALPLPREPVAPVSAPLRLPQRYPQREDAAPPPREGELLRRYRPPVFAVPRNPLIYDLRATALASVDRPSATPRAAADAAIAAYLAHEPGQGTPAAPRGRFVDEYA